MLSNCTECGKLFNKQISEFCPECQRKINEYYQVIRDYIIENGAKTVTELHDGTGINEKWILLLMSEGRLKA